MSKLLDFISILIFFLSLSICLSSHSPSVTKPPSFSFTIINRNSPRSPFYNPKQTRFDRVQASIVRSFARRNHTETLLEASNSVEMPVWPEAYEYVMEYYIGTPPVRTYTVIDTVSSLTWLQCLPCEACYNQSIPIFDPEKSSSYYQLRCGDIKCAMIRSNRCGTNNFCQYTVSYNDGSNTLGNLIQETLIFRDGVENITIKNVLIGCGYKNADTTMPNGFMVPGLIGLTRESSSIISQLSYKRFSYCFGDFDDKDALGYVKFGEVAITSGIKTPTQSIPYHPFFYINLEGISVDNVKLLIPADTFTVKNRYPRGGFFIDAGRTYTLLNRTGFDILVDSIMQKMQNFTRLLTSKNMFELCYVIGWVNLKFAPIVTFHFKGANLQLPLQNTWLKIKENVHCLAMMATSTNGRSKLGNYQQQNINVGYDLENNLISFDLMYCSN